MNDVGTPEAWPVLRLRSRAGRVTAAGPVHCVFGNPRVVDGGDRPSDPYAEWHWDGSRLLARNDRYGVFPIFYATTADEIMLSPSVVALLDAGAPRRLDAAAVATLLRVGFLMGEDTPFEAIRVLPPFGELVWEDGRCTVTGRLLFGRVTPRDRAAAIDEYVDRFREAVRRRAATGPTVVPLSGGRDSRHIFLELHAQGRAPDAAVTVGPTPITASDHVAVTAALARRAGVSHDVVYPARDRWHAQRGNARDTQLCTLEHWWVRPLMDYLRGKGAVVYEGVAGDVMSTYFRQSPKRHALFAAGDYAGLADDFMGDEGYLPSVLPKALYARFSRELARERVARELVCHTGAHNPVASFLLYNRTRRVTGLSPSVLLGRHATVWCPYLDADLCEFFSSLSLDVIGGPPAPSHQFHTDAIARAYPAFADLPYSRQLASHVSAPSYELGALRVMVAELLRERPPLVSPTFVLPRVARALLSPEYRWEMVKMTPFLAYLAELGTHADSGH